MKKYLTTALCTFIIISSSCIFSNDDNDDNEINDFRFPLKVGNSWEYLEVTSIFNYRTNNNIIHQDSSDTINVIVEIVGTETLQDSIDTYVFKTKRFREDGSFYEGLEYYQESEDGLHLVAYNTESGWSLALKAATEGNTYYNGKYFNSVNELRKFVEHGVSFQKTSAEPEYDPLAYPHTAKTLKYPLEIGSQWYYSPAEGSFSWDVGKKVLDKEEIQVPAGTFQCYKIAWLIDLDNNGEWDDDVLYHDFHSSAGLIRRYNFFKDVPWFGESIKDSLGMRDASVEYVLTDYHLE